jgi:D-hydroxyproline dehydrogenase subunit alpha
MAEGTFDVLVVGAGPAGLAAAQRAAESGAGVALVDDNPQPGGQIWRSDPERWRPMLGGRVELIPGARIVAFPALAAASVERFDDCFDISYRNLVLATGARERFLPFPGWTLPNVTGAGGLQALAKSGLPVAGSRVVVAGTGPLLPAVAKYLADHGADVRLVAEQAEASAVMRFALGLILHPSKAAQAVRLRPPRYLTGCWPVAAHGSGKLESVTLRRGARTWKEPCDYLACGFGLVPNLELPALAGSRLGGRGVEVDEYQLTSVPNVWCAGEATGIGGLDLALVEGEIAGYAAAGKPAAARRLFAERSRHRRFAAALERAFALREELKRLPADDTLVCRCEDVPFGRIRGCSGWRDAKLQTRCGMGPCQGRVCGNALEFLLGWKTESVRPPAFPARIETLTGPRCPRP